LVGGHQCAARAAGQVADANATGRDGLAGPRLAVGARPALVARIDPEFVTGPHRLAGEALGHLLLGPSVAAVGRATHVTLTAGDEEHAVGSGDTVQVLAARCRPLA